jgi:hypothetical protein
MMRDRTTLLRGNPSDIAKDGSWSNFLLAICPFKCPSFACGAATAEPHLQVPKHSACAVVSIPSTMDTLCSRHGVHLGDLSSIEFPASLDEPRPWVGKCSRITSRSRLWVCAKAPPPTMNFGLPCWMPGEISSFPSTRLPGLAQYRGGR